MKSRTSWLRSLAALAAVIAFAGTAQAQLYGVNPFQNAAGTPPDSYGLFHLDPATGANVDGRVITLPGFTVTGAQALARDPTTGLVYTVLKVSAVSGRVLATVNVASGVATQVGNLGDNFSSLAFRANGQLYGVTGDGASVPETLYLIDKSNASKAIARALGNGADGELIAYGPVDDALFHWSGNGSVVFERIEADPPYTVTGIPVTGTPGGESFGAVWDPTTSRFLVHNIGSQMRPWSTGGVVGAALGSAGSDVRGMAFVPPVTVSSITRVDPNPTNATSVDFLVTFSEAVSGVDPADFALTATGTATGTVAAASGSGSAWTVTVNAITGDGTLRLDLTDDDSILGVANALGGPGAGNGDFTAGEAYTLDTVPPAVTAVAVPADGTYVLGDILTFTVQFDDSVTVDSSGGTPTLPLTIGALARDAGYVSGSGSTSLVFAYTVQSGDLDGDGIAIGGSLALNGGTLLDAFGSPALLALNGVPLTTAVLVDSRFIVSPGAGPNGTIAPAAPQAVFPGGSAVFTVTPAAGYAAVVGGTCGGTLVGNTYTTNPVTASCTVAASFTVSAITTYSGPSATGSGTITASFTGGGPACTFAVSEFIPLTGHARSPPTVPASLAFPHGLFDFTTSGCTPGSTITMTMTYPQALPAGTQYWKYGPTPGNAAPHWYVLPAAIAGSTATFSITDGQLGDDDLAANGTIVDQGGPGVPAAGAVPVPTLSQWMLALMAILMLLATMRVRRH